MTTPNDGPAELAWRQRLSPNAPHPGPPELASRRVMVAWFGLVFPILVTVIGLGITIGRGDTGLQLVNNLGIWVAAGLLGGVACWSGVIVQELRWWRQDEWDRSQQSADRVPGQDRGLPDD